MQLATVRKIVELLREECGGLLSHHADAMEVQLLLVVAATFDELVFLDHPTLLTARVEPFEGRLIAEAHVKNVALAAFLHSPLSHLDIELPLLDQRCGELARGRRTEHRGARVSDEGVLL